MCPQILCIILIIVKCTIYVIIYEYIHVPMSHWGLSYQTCHGAFYILLLVCLSDIFMMHLYRPTRLNI